jgi:hypothetical protein
MKKAQVQSMIKTNYVKERRNLFKASRRKSKAKAPASRSVNGKV